MIDRAIIVIDDSEDDRFILDRAFKQVACSAKIMILSDGAEAISYLKAEGEYADRTKYQLPALVITDLKMGKVNGFDLLHYIKNDSHFLHIPVIILSGSSISEDILKCYASRANAYHAKPAAFNDMKRLVQAICDYWLRAELPKPKELKD